MAVCLALQTLPGPARPQDPRVARFVTTSKGTAVLDEASLARAKRLVGLKAYVTNIPASAMPAQEVIDSYRDLWHVEQSFCRRRLNSEQVRRLKSEHSSTIGV